MFKKDSAVLYRLKIFKNITKKYDDETWTYGLLISEKSVEIKVLFCNLSVAYVLSLSIGSSSNCNLK